MYYENLKIAPAWEQSASDFRSPYPIWDEALERHLAGIFNPGPLPVKEKHRFRKMLSSLFEPISEEPVPPEFAHLTGCIWGKDYPFRKRSWFESLACQLLLFVIFIAGFFSYMSFDDSRQLDPRKPVQITAIDLAPYLPPKIIKHSKTKGGGGGGDRSQTAASRGKLPRVAPRQFTPPTAIIRNENPRLIIEPSLVAPTLRQTDAKNYGDPLSKILDPSNGPGINSGIGSGTGQGIGPGGGPGFGPGTGGNTGGIGPYMPGGDVTRPILISSTLPEYTEEARALGFQGTVRLYIEVGLDGKAHNIKMLHSVGLGLDRKARECVQKWTFAPGKKSGVPVVVIGYADIVFRLQ